MPRVFDCEESVYVSGLNQRLSCRDLTLRITYGYVHKAKQRSDEGCNEQSHKKKSNDHIRLSISWGLVLFTSFVPTVKSNKVNVFFTLSRSMNRVSQRIVIHNNRALNVALFTATFFPARKCVTPQNSRLKLVSSTLACPTWAPSEIKTMICGFV